MGKIAAAQPDEPELLDLSKMGVILEQIVASVRQNLAERKRQTPLSELERLTDHHPSSRDFQGKLQGEEIKLIAEVKRASPSKGWLRSDLDVAMQVRSYVQGGAAAISVLTEPAFFKGSFADLMVAREATELPLLCKDFILDSYQIYEARAHGADAVLLIASILSLAELAELVEVARQMRMSALVEVHNELEVEKALAVKASLVGINNRNLADFSTDLNTTFRLLPLLPASSIVVSESGIKSRADVLALQEAGVKAILVGEALVTSADPKSRIRELMGK